MDPTLGELCALLATSEAFEPACDPSSITQALDSLTKNHLPSEAPKQVQTEKNSLSNQKLLEALLKLRGTQMPKLNSTRIIKNTSHS